MHTIFHRAYYAWKRWRNPRPKRVLLHIVYRDYNEQYKRLVISPALLRELCNKTFAHENVRAMRVYEEQFYGHKSYMDDTLPDLDELLKLVKKEPEKS